MGLRAGLDRCGKSRPPPGFDPRTAQPVASRYTDYANMGLVPEGKALYNNEINNGNMVNSGCARWPEHAAEGMPNFASKTSGEGFVKCSVGLLHPRT